MEPDLPVFLHELLHIGAAVIEENTDLAVLKRLLPPHPDLLAVVEARLHAVAGDAHAVVRPFRHLAFHLAQLVMLAVQELARAGGYRQVVQRQHTPWPRLLFFAEGVAGAQQRGVLRHPLAPGTVEPGEQTVRLAAEFAHHVADLQRPAQGQKLHRAGRRPLVFPFGDGVLGHVHAVACQCGGQLALGQAQSRSSLLQHLSDFHTFSPSSARMSAMGIFTPPTASHSSSRLIFPAAPQIST